MAPRVLVFFGLIGTALLAACGGGGGVTPSATPTPAPSASATATPTPSSTATPTPSSTATPTPSGTATPTPSGGATPTPTPGAATFNGGTQTITATSSGGTFTVSPPDATYAGTMTFGANNATGNFNFTMSWATFAQISGTFTPGALPTTTGTAFLYLDFVTNTTVQFNATPAFTVTGSSFPGTKCGFAFYGVAGSGTGGSPQWNAMTAIGLAEVTPSGGSFSVPATTLPPGDNVQFDAGSDQYIALYCH